MGVPYLRNPAWVDGVTQATAATMENFEAGIRNAEAPPHVPPVVGKSRVGAILPSSAWQFVSPDVAYFHPVFYETTFGIDGFGVHLRGGVASTIRLGIYANDPTGFRPGLVKAQTSLDGSAAGWKEAYITAVPGLAAGWYWHAFSTTASADIFCLSDGFLWQDGGTMEAAIRQDSLGTRCTTAAMVGAFTDNPASGNSAHRAPSVGVRIA